MGNDTLDPVVAAGASLCTDSKLARIQTDIIIDHDELLRRVQFVKVYDFPQTFTTEIHISLGFHQNHLLPFDIAAAADGLMFLRVDRDVILLCQLIQGIKTHIMTGMLVLLSRISKSCYDIHI